MKYSKIFLINELYRFVDEYNEIPTIRKMNNLGFPGCYGYCYYFGSWNNALVYTNLKDSNDIKLYRKYYELCEFQIHENDYYKIPNFPLYEKYKSFERYKDKVVLDHIFSRKDGFRNKLDPRIISHPANSQFLTIEDNSRKRDRSDISIDDLKRKIIQWEEIYNGDVDLYLKIFNSEIKTREEVITKISKITGRKYDKGNKNDWDDPRKHKSAMILAKAFGFELQKENTLANIMDAIEQIRKSYHDEKMSSTQVKEKYGIDYARFDTFMKESLGITLRSNEEAHFLLRGIPINEGNTVRRGTKHSDETKQKQRNAKKHISNETREKMSMAAIKRGYCRPLKNHIFNGDDESIYI